MIVKVGDLKLGDKILIPGGSKFRTLIVVKEPVKVISPNGYEHHKSIRCSERVIKKIVQKQRYDHVTKTYKLRDHEIKTREHTFENHNVRINMVLDYKDIWLVERDGQLINEQV